MAIQFTPARHFEYKGLKAGEDHIIAAEYILGGVGIDTYPLHYSIVGLNEVQAYNEYKVQLRAYLLPLYENEDVPSFPLGCQLLLNKRVLKMKDSDPEALFSDEAADNNTTQADRQLGKTADTSQIWKLHRMSNQILTDSLQSGAALLKKEVIVMGNGYAGRSLRDKDGKIFYRAMGKADLRGGVMPIGQDAILVWVLLLPPDVADNDTEVADIPPSEWEDLGFLRLRRDWLGNIENLVASSKNKVVKWLDWYLVEDKSLGTTAANGVRMTRADDMAFLCSGNPSFMQVVQSNPHVAPNAGN